MKLLCKNNIFTISKGLNVGFNKRKSNEVLNLTTNEYYQVLIDNSWYRIIDDKGKEMWFSIIEDIDWCVWNYFYTLKEERKLKLEEIETISNSI